MLNVKAIMNCAVFALFCQLPLFFTCFQLRSTMKGLLPAKDFHPAKNCTQPMPAQLLQVSKWQLRSLSSIGSIINAIFIILIIISQGGQGPYFFWKTNNSQKLVLSRFHLDNYPKILSGKLWSGPAILVKIGKYTSARF